MSSCSSINSPSRKPATQLMMSKRNVITTRSTTKDSSNGNNNKAASRFSDAENAGALHNRPSASSSCVSGIPSLINKTSRTTGLNQVKSKAQTQTQTQAQIEAKKNDDKNNHNAAALILELQKQLTTLQQQHAELQQQYTLLKQKTETQQQTTEQLREEHEQQIKQIVDQQDKHNLQQQQTIEEYKHKLETLERQTMAVTTSVVSLSAGNECDESNDVCPLLRLCGLQQRVTHLTLKTQKRYQHYQSLFDIHGNNTQETGHLTSTQGPTSRTPHNTPRTSMHGHTQTHTGNIDTIDSIVEGLEEGPLLSCPTSSVLHSPASGVCSSALNSPVPVSSAATSASSPFPARLYSCDEDKSVDALVSNPEVENVPIPDAPPLILPVDENIADRSYTESEIFAAAY